jgi:hypothetical protein
MAGLVVIRAVRCSNGKAPQQGMTLESGKGHAWIGQSFPNCSENAPSSVDGLLWSGVLSFILLGVLHLFIPGVAVFALVHIVYVMRHLRGISSLVAEGILAGFCLVFAIVIMRLSSPAMARAGLLHESIAYAVPLTFSLYAGIGVMIRDHFRMVHRIRIAAGIVLFFAVDIAVAHFQALPGGLMRTILGIAIWPLYLPSQFLLACSGSGAKQGVPVCVSVPRPGPSNAFLRLRLD